MFIDEWIYHREEHISFHTYRSIFKNNQVWRPANGFFLLSILMWFFGSGTITPFLFWSNGNGAERKRYWTTFNQFDVQSKQQDKSLHLIIWSTYWDCLTCFANHFHLVFYLKLPRSWRTRYEHLANQLLFYSTRLQLSGNWFIPHFYQMFCYHHQDKCHMYHVAKPSLIAPCIKESSYGPCDYMSNMQLH